MDQRRIAGIGNLLADEILWRARVHPARAVGSLTAQEQARLLGPVATRSGAALRDGGVHTLTIIPHRHREAPARAITRPWALPRSTGGQAGGARPSSC